MARLITFMSKPTPLKGKSLDVIKEAVPWRKGAVKEKVEYVEDEEKNVKAKARPRPKEVREDEATKGD